MKAKPKEARPAAYQPRLADGSDTVNTNTFKNMQTAKRARTKEENEHAKHCLTASLTDPLSTPRRL